MTSVDTRFTDRPTATETVQVAPIPLIPVGLRVGGKKILVVGAGPIAARKAEPYITHGALVTVVAPDHSPAMDRLAASKRLYRRFAAEDLVDTWLVIAATGLPEVDGAVFAAAEERQVWCNAADDPDHCSVILPAVARRGPLTVSIATGGTSPAVASWIRRRIEGLLDRHTLEVAEVTGRVRRAVRDAGHRTEVPGWAEVLDRDALNLVAAGQPEELERRLFEAVVGR